ncbi:MAG: hypothetical protein HKO57_08025, partial [Akkermansiaceae bacterium]|nr:hypothetical protein [Akkermansiaceae bacterium]
MAAEATAAPPAPGTAAPPAGPRDPGVPSPEDALTTVQKAAAGPPLKGRKSGYIIGPMTDSIALIYSPLIALAIGIFISQARVMHEEVSFMGHRDSPVSMFIGTFIMAHLFLVFFRSHGNKQIFQLHPMRFTLVPIALFAAMMSSVWVAVTVSVIATWWDVYHSSMQTFGIGRIYDMKAGNKPMTGRRLDHMLNLLLYTGPILAGASLMAHIEDFDEYEAVGSVFFTSIPAYTMDRQSVLTWILLLVGVPFLLYYLYYYWRLSKAGTYKVPYQKVALLVSTGFCSIYT